MAGFLADLGKAAGACYLIKNKASRMCLTAVDYNPQKKQARVEQWLPCEKQKRYVQRWLLMPIDKNGFLIANRSSGLVLNIGDKKEASLARLSLLNKDAKTTPSWLMHPISSAEHSGPPCFGIVNAISGLYLTVAMHEVRDGSNVDQQSFQKHKAERNFQLWEFELVEHFTKIVRLDNFVSRPTHDVGSIIEMKSAEDVPPWKTELKIIGRAIIPFPLVKDITRQTVALQSKESPYYILIRYGCWSRLYHSQHQGGFKVDVSMQNIKVGLATENALAVKTAVGITVKGDGGLMLEPLMLARYGNKLGTYLKMELTAYNVKDHKQKTMPHRLTLGPGNMAVAVWYKEDVYVLEDLSGNKLLQWIVRRPESKGKHKNQIVDTFPSK